VSGPLRERWQPVYDATSTSLEATLKGLEVGMIVHDSEHTYECEHFELTTAVTHAAPTIALVSDNAHATTALRDIAASLASTTTSSESGHVDISTLALASALRSERRFSREPDEAHRAPSRFSTRV
jgi:hypothetical protein